tara:strand:- start:876 stop:1040 length:165 start_codon:yes stop_codon:yes gene_type:complete
MNSQTMQWVSIVTVGGIRAMTLTTRIYHGAVEMAIVREDVVIALKLEQLSWESI